MQNGLKNARKYFNSIAASAAFLLEYILIKSVESDAILVILPQMSDRERLLNML